MDRPRSLVTVLAATAASVVTAAAASSSIPAFEGCDTGAQVRPTTIQVACGDGNFFITGLKWTTWAPKAAAATGTGHQNDCKPYCAAGHFHVYPLTLRLSRPVKCSNGRVEYTRFTYRFTKSKPPLATRWSNTITSPFITSARCP